MTSTISWDVTVCSLVEINRRIASIFRIEEWAKKETNKKKEFLVGLLGLLFYSEDGGSVFLRNVADFHLTARCYIPEYIQLLFTYDIDISIWIRGALDKRCSLITFLRRNCKSISQCAKMCIGLPYYNYIRRLTCREIAYFSTTFQ
jgi:hypothetical protein